MHTLTLAHSPDADDMVMWWPLVGMRDPDGQPITTELGEPLLRSDRFAFDPLPDDVQRLNRRAIETGDLDITAISGHAYAACCGTYAITACGASIGEGYGPKLVVSEESSITTLEQALDQPGPIAVPGLHTTAYLTLSVLAGRKLDAKEMLFSDIPDAVSSGDVHAGLLIHEAQLEFDRLGLRSLIDLGKAWRERRGTVLPLGLNVIRRDLDERFGAGSLAEVAGLLEQSIRIARERREDSKALLRMHADDRPEWLDAALVDRYLDMYVSDRTQDMGEDAKRALTDLLDEGAALDLCAKVPPIELVRSG